MTQGVIWKQLVNFAIPMALGLLFQQLLIPKERESVVSLLDLIDGLIRTVPAYLLKCNISREAAELSYAALTKGSTP